VDVLSLKSGLDSSPDSYVLLDASGRAFCDEIGCLLIVYGSEGARALKRRAEELGYRSVKVVKYVSESLSGLKVFVPKGKVYDEKLSLWYSSYRLAHVELFSRKAHLPKVWDKAMKSGKPKRRAQENEDDGTKAPPALRRTVQSAISRTSGRRPRRRP
jgi:hypothetical protein